MSSPGSLSPLDKETRFNSEGLVQGKLYPDAFEASAQGVGARRARHDAGISMVPPPISGHDKAQHVKRVAAYRARACVRRYAVANNLNTLATFTTAVWRPRHEVEQAMEKTIGASRRELGKRFPYVWIFEGENTNRPHAHALLPEEALAPMMARWPFGYAHCKFLDLVEDIRAAAEYLSKDFMDSPPGRQRYRTARGFQPKVVEISADSLEEFEIRASRELGGLVTTGLVQPSAYGGAGRWDCVRLEWQGQLVTLLREDADGPAVACTEGEG